MVILQNENDVNDYLIKIKLKGSFSNSKNNIRYVNCKYDNKTGNYSCFIYGLIRNSKYEFSIYYGEKKLNDNIYVFKTIDIETYTDQRDGKIYETANYGNKTWMLNNLSFDTQHSISMNDTLLTGNYYTWDDAQNACPEGWHIPTDDEWIELEKYIGVGLNDWYIFSQKRGSGDFSKLSSRIDYSLFDGLEDNDAINELGFSSYPCGYLDNINQVKSQDFGLAPYFWTSTEKDNLDGIFHGGSIFKDEKKIDKIYSVRMYLPKSKLLPVRCVKN
jgi:uncharacterized protein (TIGR02145 family)